MCEGKCSGCAGKKCGEYRALPGEKSKKIKEDLFKYESGGTFWRVTNDSADRIPVYEKMEGLRMWDMFRWKEGAQLVNETNPYYGIYFSGPGLYDMDGDGRNDLELYVDKQTSSPADGLPVLRIGSDIILSDMDALRAAVDQAEAIIPGCYLPYPTYDELLFSLR